MKFGVREICDVVFKAKKSGYLGSYHYDVGQPVLYIDTAKTSTIEGAATTVYATGGRGNSRLIAWEGEKTLTFTVEDALMSDKSMAILTGAGLLNIPKSADPTKPTIYVHRMEETELTATIRVLEGEISSMFFYLDKDITSKISSNKSCFVIGKTINNTYFSFPSNSFSIMKGSSQQYSIQLTSGEIKEVDAWVQKFINERTNVEYLQVSIPVIVDYYTAETAAVSELTIDVGNFAGYYYVEAETNFRRQSDGKDLKAMITFPNVKIQSNFTFAMAATGDPSTFTFTMDAMPGTTISNPNKKVLCEMKIIEEGMAIDGGTSANDSIYYGYKKSLSLYLMEIVDDTGSVNTAYHDKDNLQKIFLDYGEYNNKIVPMIKFQDGPQGEYYNIAYYESSFASLPSQQDESTPNNKWRVFELPGQSAENPIDKDNAYKKYIYTAVIVEGNKFINT